MYVNSEGIHGFKIPEIFHPLNDGQAILMSSCCESQVGVVWFNHIPSTFSLPHVKPYDANEGAAIIGPNHLLPISETQPLLYIVKEIDPWLGRIVLQWYRFCYNSTDPGAGSTLTLIKTTPLTYNVDLIPHRYHLYNDHVEIL